MKESKKPKISVLYDFNTFGAARPGFYGTPVILYVIGATRERIGTESDERIINSMLNRGYAVIKADFKSTPEILGDFPPFTVHELARKASFGELFADKTVFPEGRYYDTLTVPSGYDVSLFIPFWSIDKHGGEGILESIVNNWNTDLRARKGERLVYWLTSDGRRKPLNCDTEDAWLNENGEPDKNGGYVKLKHTVANDITHCVKADGSFVKMTLNMHLIYPAKPKRDVPVMCLSNSSEHLSMGLCSEGRPQMTDFLLRGYAGVVFDHLYQPMAYADCYGYYDGNPKTGGVSGDPASYSLQFFCDKKVNTAAMRCIRYLSLSEHEKYSFDCEKIGVYGNSKGGWMNFLGSAELRKPAFFDKSEFKTLEEAVDAKINSFHSMRQFSGEADKSRFQAGKTEAFTRNGITVHGGELQPFLTYGGTEIPSHANLIYTSCGGNCDDIGDGFAPTFVSMHLPENYRPLSDIANLARAHNIDCTYFVLDIGHDLAHGKDVLHGVDSYKAFMEFVDAHLLGKAPKLLYIEPVNGKTLFEDAKITLKFTAPIPLKEIQKTEIAVNRHRLSGEWKSALGMSEWTFLPSSDIEKGTLTVKLPNFPFDYNGKPTDFSYTVTSPIKANTATVKVPKVLDFGEYGGDISFPSETVHSNEPAPDGTPSLKLYIKSGSHKTLLTNPVLFTANGFASDISAGETVKTVLQVYDTEERTLTVRLPCRTDRKTGTVDLCHGIHNFKTEPEKWKTLAFEHTLATKASDINAPFTVNFEYTDGDESPLWIKFKR